MKRSFKYALLYSSYLYSATAEANGFAWAGTAGAPSSSSTFSAPLPLKTEKRIQAQKRVLRRRRVDTPYSSLDTGSSVPQRIEIDVPTNGLYSRSATSDSALFVYVGSANVEGGFSCHNMTDAEIDARLDAACDDLYPGSRNIQGADIENGNLERVLNLPGIPEPDFVASCPGCGLSCDKSGRRRCNFFEPNWDIHGPFWADCHSGSIMVAECIIHPSWKVEGL